MKPLSEGGQPYAYFRGPSEKPEPIVLPEAGIVQEALAFEEKPENLIVVPAVIHRYDSVVKKTLDSLLSATWGKQGIFEAHGEGTLDLSCTKECAHRAAKIYQTLLQSLKKRGFSLVVKGTYTDCYGERIKVSIREKLEKVPYKRPNGQSPLVWGEPQFSFIPTGRLMLRVGEQSDSRKYCMDEPDKPLEEQLNAFMVQLAKEALRIKRKRLEQERWQREWEAKQQAREAAQQKAEREQVRREVLIQWVNNWVKATKIREFIDAVRDTSVPIHDEELNKEQWLAWASAYADELDPLQVN